MARENQGLQIALIIFVMLTVLLGVTTFLCYRKYGESQIDAKNANERTAAAEKKSGELQKELDDTRAFIRVPAGKSLDEVRTQFDKDMAAYGEAFEPATRYYSLLLAQLANTVNAQAEAIKTANDRVAELTRKIQLREEEKDPQINQLTAAVKKAGDEKVTATGAFQTEIDRVHKEQDLSLGVIKKVEREANERADRIEAEKKELAGALKETIKVKEDLIAARRTTDVSRTPDRPNGQITQSSARTGTVFIDLGQADSLERGVTFTIYPANTSNLAKAAKKATIEITDIIGPHMAQARVLDDKAADPIVQGDKIYNPLWSSEPRHFALTGLMDLDGDGRSALSRVRSLITGSGGVIDAYMDDKTGKMEGKMSANTRFLVIGKEPAGKAGGKDGKDSQFETFTKMQREAAKLGVAPMPLQELKEKMGYKPQATVQRFGSGGSGGSGGSAGAGQPPAKAPDAAQKKATGNTTDAFSKRQPPAGGAGAP
jgi:hypothetical protein